MKADVLIQELQRQIDTNGNLEVGYRDPEDGSFIKIIEVGTRPAKTKDKSNLGFYTPDDATLGDKFIYLSYIDE